MIAAILIMLSNYTHDLATGLMFGSVLAYGVAAKVVGNGRAAEDGNAAIGALHSRFRPVVLWSLTAVLVLGVPRMIFYYDYEWLPAAGRGQIVALVIKHVFLVSLTVGSLVWFFKQRPQASHDALTRPD